MKKELAAFGGPSDIALSVAFVVFGAVLYASPARVATIDLPLPWLAVTPIFLWAVIRPGLAASLGAFGAGIVQDVISGGPIGVWAFAFLVAYVVTVGQRDALLGQSGAAVWIGFGLCVVACAVASLLSGWISMSSTAWSASPPPEIEGLGDLLSRGGASPETFKHFVQAVVTIAAAPLMVRPFRGFARIGMEHGAIL